MSNLQNILSSFKIKDDLNPKFWEPSDNPTSGETQFEMVSKVRDRLLDIANEFINMVGVDFLVDDIIMTGSLSNYNWSKYSDVDLHILVDFKQFTEQELPLYTELFKLNKTLYNDNHNIKIFGYDVELYVQDTSEQHVSSGEYSIMFNEWVTIPEKEKVKINQTSIKSKTKEWMKLIDSVISNVESEDSLEKSKTIIKNFTDKLKKFRTSGLDNDGEYSLNNLVFKTLRRNGYIKKLYDFQSSHIDKNLSLKEMSPKL